jgi:DNA (cytosine-5)-methyltransferase 1
MLTTLEICAGGGGQSLGLEQAGIGHAAAVEIDAHACQTLRRNRPAWQVLECDVHSVDGKKFRGIDLLSGGVPCPPFSIAGKQLGHADDRDLFPQALRLAEEARPNAVLLENVRGLASEKFTPYRNKIRRRLESLGYVVGWQLLNSSDLGVPQLRPRFFLVAIKTTYASGFQWPEPLTSRSTVGDAIQDLMAAGGWPGAAAWAAKAQAPAPTIVGGSKKHGGPDLGPTRARLQWRSLGVDGLGLADEPPNKSFPRDGLPRLTVRMVARLQGFPDSWTFSGGKTAAYRQVGNALPPPVAKSLGLAIGRALRGEVPKPARRKRALAEPRHLSLFEEDAT